VHALGRSRAATCVVPAYVAQQSANIKHSWSVIPYTDCNVRMFRTLQNLDRAATAMAGISPELEASIKYFRHEPTLVMRSVKKMSLHYKCTLCLLTVRHFSVTGSYSCSEVNNSLVRKPNVYFPVT
jgi:hypothetical protein